MDSNMLNFSGIDNPTWFMGIVEDRNDPINHGRIRVRAFGYHPPLSTREVLTQDLPWAFIINSTGGAFFNIPDEGEFVFGFFADGRDAQHPIILGTIPGAHMGLPYEGRVGSGIGQIDSGLAAAAGIVNQSRNAPPIDAASLPPLQGTVEQRSNQAFEFFVSQGWTNEQAAGIVGNLIVESNLDPRAYYGGTSSRPEQSFGIAQWNDVGSPERIANAKRELGVSDLREATFEQQLEFVQWELTNTERRAADRLKNTSDAASAARVFDQYYERSDGSKREERAAQAQRLLAGGS